MLAGLMAVLATLASVAPVRSFAATESLVRDINPGAGDSAPYNLANLGGTLYFNATDPAHGAELWRSDGTAAGTRMVSDIDPGAGKLAPLLPHRRRRHPLLPGIRPRARLRALEVGRDRGGNEAGQGHRIRNDELLPRLADPSRECRLFRGQ